MLIVMQQIVNLFHKETQNTPRFVSRCLQMWCEHKSITSSVHFLFCPHQSYTYTLTNSHISKRMQVSTHPLPTDCVFSLSLPLSCTHTLSLPITHIPTHFSQTRFRWFWGDFMVAVLLMVPVKHETFLFPSNHTHMCCLWAVIEDIHRQSETSGWRQLNQARKSCQVLHWATHTHKFAHLSWIFMVYFTLHLALL